MCNFKLENNLSKLVNQDLEVGFNLIKQIVEDKKIDYYVKIVNSINIDIVYIHFEKWLKEVLSLESPSNMILAFYFGLFESTESVQLYVSGSTEWDEDDSDWPCNMDYYPENRYPKMQYLWEIRNVEEDVILGVFINLGITALLVKKFINSNHYMLLGERDEVYLSIGFDDGIIYNLFKLTKEGFVIQFK